MNQPTLGNPQNTIAVLQKYNFSFQKKFGQNFLIDTHVLDKIIRSAEITKDDFVLEIGPGIGTMTQYLACAAREVVAVEIDKALIPILEDTLSSYDNVTVINEDVLKLDIVNWLRREMEGNQSKWWQTFRTILRHRSLWDFLRVMSRCRALQLWCKKRSQTACRLDLERKTMGHCRSQCNIMQSHILQQMFHRIVLCRDRK